MSIKHSLVLKSADMGNAVEIKAVGVSYHNEMELGKKDTRHLFVTKNLRSYATRKFDLHDNCLGTRRRESNGRCMVQDH